MEVRILGSGGNTPIPTPTCTCPVCEQARREGIPYARGGNSLYLPDLTAIIDAPEFVFRALNRERVPNIEYIFLTHWHPDHVNGLRVVQSRDMTAHDGLLDALGSTTPTLVTTEAVYDRVTDIFGQIDHFVQQGFTDTHFLDDDPLEINGTSIRSIPYALEGDSLDATAFVIENDETTTVIAADDARYLSEEALPSAIDLAVFECGLFEEGPDGTALFTDADWAFLDDELRHDEIRARIDRLDPDRTILTEIEHLTARSHDHYLELQKQEAYERIRFAYDGLSVTV